MRRNAPAEPDHARFAVRLRGIQARSIMKFDTSGKLLKSFGAGIVLFPHGL